MNDPQVTTEHAVLMAGGDMCIRNPHPDIERVYPLKAWISGRINVDRAKVYRRRVIVVEDWVEVTNGSRNERER